MPGAGRLILVVEDDHEARNVLIMILEEEGYRAIGAIDAESGLALLREHPATALVLLDILLPGASGWEFRRTQLAEPEIADIPAVIYSVLPPALGSRSPRPLGQNLLQICAYIRKPANLDVLLAEVARCLRAHP